MRTALLTATFVACFGVVDAYAQGQPRPRTQVPTARPTAPPSSSGTSVAVIDIGFIFKNATLFKRAMDDVEKDTENFNKSLEQRKATLQAKLDRLRGLPQGDPQFRALEEEIANENTQVRLDVARHKKDRLEREAKIYYNAYQDIDRTVRAFVDRHGIDLVLRFNSEQMDPAKPDSVLSGINRFVVFQRNINITQNILEDMNRRNPPPQPRVGGGGGTPRRPANTFPKKR